MIKDVNLGYIFELKKDCVNEYGLITRIKISQNKNIRKVYLTIGVDTSGNIVPQMKEEKTLGFVPMDTDEIESRIRGNKSFLNLVGEFAIILSGYIELDTKTNKIVSTDNIAFYIPTNVQENYKDKRNANGDIMPVAVCDILTSESDELHSMTVQQTLLDTYLSNVLRYITTESTNSKQDFIANIFAEQKLIRKREETNL